MRNVFATSVVLLLVMLVIAVLPWEALNRPAQVILVPAPAVKTEITAPKAIVVAPSKLEKPVQVEAPTIPKVVVVTDVALTAGPTLHQVLMASLPEYGWKDSEVTAILAAFKDGKNVETITIKETWYGDTWGSPYERRWSEANMIAHLRDEHPAGANVIVITTETRRYTVLFDGCGGIEKIAVGEKPVPQSTPRVHTPATRKTPVVATSRPAPVGVTMICTLGCE